MTNFRNSNLFPFPVPDWPISGELNLSRLRAAQVEAKFANTSRRFIMGPPVLCFDERRITLAALIKSREVH